MRDWVGRKVIKLLRDEAATEWETIGEWVAGRDSVGEQVKGVGGAKHGHRT